MDLTMPRLSDTMEEGTLGRWLKQEGDRIDKGEIIAEIQTDKANMDLEAFEGGVLEKILVQEGETVPVGQAIAVVGDGSGQASAGRSAPAQEPEQAVEAGNGTEAGAPAQEAPQQIGQPEAQPSQRETSEVSAEPSGPQGRVKASPLARRLAQEFGVNLSTIEGTGPNGRIVKEDIEKAASARKAEQPATVQTPEAAAQAAPAPGEVRPMSRMQKIVAQRVTQSKTQVPHIYITVEIGMDAAIKLREDLNAISEQKVTFDDIVVKGCAAALKSFPMVNASYSDEGIRFNSEINIGVAVALPDGLIVPVVKQADKKLLRDIAAEKRELIQKARENKLSINDLSGGTFSVSNMGMLGVEEFAAIINQPESAILAVGSIVQKPVVEDGEIRIGNRMKVTLSADHRVHNGADVAKFLQELKRLLETPLNLGF